MKLRSNLISLLIVAFVLHGCGGGGGDGGGSDTTNTQQISGTVMAPAGQIAYYEQKSIIKQAADFIIPSAIADLLGLSPVANAKVEIIKINSNGNQVGDPLASTMTDSEGKFDVAIDKDVPLNAQLVAQVKAENGKKLRAFILEEEVSIDPASEYVVVEVIASDIDLTLVENHRIQSITAAIKNVDLDAAEDIETTISGLSATHKSIVEEKIDDILDDLVGDTDTDPVDFKVGGTIAGLNDTITLQNNAGDNLTVDNNGFYEFTSTLKEDATYAVTILNQPEGQTCKVSNGQGVVDDDNVNSVFIVCVDNQPANTDSSSDNTGGDTAANESDKFTVGGSVVGLKGSLVLQNNASDDLNIEASGLYKFATAQSSNTPFAVTVNAQPQGQVCNVSNALGVVGNTNVYDVFVICEDIVVANPDASNKDNSNTPVAFTVGGSIIGLNGTIILQNNANDDLTRDSSGLYTFRTSQADNTPYAITIAQQPENQNCEISNGIGVVAAANINDVFVICSDKAVDTPVPGKATSFTIGGSVVGLNGKLVLQNNASDELNLAANGLYAFPTALAENSAYAVTILTQPAGQTCEVQNGLGVMPANNVNNVFVVCADNTPADNNSGGDNSGNDTSAKTYSIGGTLSGLKGSVVLQNNATDTLTLSSNGSFVFGTKLANNENYLITILNQPNGLVCDLNNASGVVAESNVNSISINCVELEYSIGGSITGLKGSIVLRNNAGDDLTLFADGTYEFSTKLKQFEAYSVTVFAQPQGQDCQVTNNIGSVGTIDVKTAVVACIDIDSDNDGLSDLDEDVYGTDPGDIDTDGDGVSDGKEVNEYNFDAAANPFKWNPLIADLPKIEIAFATPPSIWVNDSQTQSKAAETSHQTGSVTTTESSYTGGFSIGIEVGVEFEAEVGITNFGTKSKNSFSFSAETQHSWTDSEATETHDTWNTAKSIEESTGLDGGGISAGVVIRNIGHTAFKIQNLILNASEFSFGDDNFSLIGNLALQDLNENPNYTIDLAPVGSGLNSETGVISFEKVDLNTETALALLKDSRSIALGTASYNLLTGSGESYVSNGQDVAAKTVTLEIDYAYQSPPEKHYVAARSVNGQSATLADIFSVLQVNGEAMVEIGNDLVYPDRMGITSVRNVYSVYDDILGSDLVKTGRWLVVHNHNNGFTTESTIYDAQWKDQSNNDGVTIVKSYNLEDIKVASGDSVSLIYLLDSDGDGVGDRHETILGMSTDTRDTDDDGLTDVNEIQGWEVKISNPAGSYSGGVVVYSDPRLEDTDGDGLSDLDEKNHREANASRSLDPQNSDTDGDGISDGPLDPDGDGPIVAGPDTDNSVTLLGDVDFKFESAKSVIAEGYIVPIGSITSVTYEVCIIFISTSCTDETLTGADLPDYDANGHLPLFKRIQSALIGYKSLRITADDSSGINFIYQQNVPHAQWAVTADRFEADNGFSLFGMHNAAQSDVQLYTANIDADPQLEFIGFGTNGVYIQNGSDYYKASSGTEFQINDRYDRDWNVDNPRYLVDLNNDGIKDVLGFADYHMQAALGYYDSADGGRLKFHKMGVWDDAGQNERFTADLDASLHLAIDLENDGDADVIEFSGKAYFGNNAGKSGWKVSNGKTVAPELTYSSLNHFGTDKHWDVNKHPRFVIDVNRDGLMDIVGFGGVFVYSSLGEQSSTTGEFSFGAVNNASKAFIYDAGYRINEHPRLVGDVNGDGYPDLIGFGEADVSVALNNMSPIFPEDERYAGGHWDESDLTKQMFRDPSVALSGAMTVGQGWYINRTADGLKYRNEHPRLLADMNNDGLLDIVGFYDDGVQVAFNITNPETPENVQFAQPELWYFTGLTTSFASTGSSWYEEKSGYRKFRQRGVADINGDGNLDIYGFATNAAVSVLTPSTQAVK